jgi:hypothetical protein
MPNTTESKEWRKMVEPAVKGLIALMAAAAFWLSNNNQDKCEIRYSELDKRISLVEQNVTGLQANQSALSGKIDKILDAVNTISIDIARMSTVIDNTTVKRK